ncbi:hypothetical protein D3C78_1192370 [compost metagenome]
MSFYFSVCSTAKYQEKYISFLLKHYTELGLPYSFQETFSYIASPVMMEKEAILMFDQDDEVAGAIGYIHGTGDKDYEDSHVIQLQILFIIEKYRGSRLLLQAAQFLAQYIDQLREPVTELRYWIPAQENALVKLSGKLAAQADFHETERGAIAEYRIPFADWHAYAMKYPHENYF